MQRILTIIILFSPFFACKVQGVIYHEKLPGITSKTHAEAAENLHEKGFNEDAIKEYQKHIEYRLTKNPDFKIENPYFYQILIGNIYLELNELDSALNAFKIAKEHQVDKALVVDGILQITKALIQGNKLEEAMKLVNDYRALDPLLFDVERDRIHRNMIYNEDFGVSLEESPR
jgi:tetratricopeptide (TPR) repeat protein